MPLLGLLWEFLILESMIRQSEILLADDIDVTVFSQSCFWIKHCVSNVTVKKKRLYSDGIWILRHYFHEISHLHSLRYSCRHSYFLELCCLLVTYLTFFNIRVCFRLRHKTLAHFMTCVPWGSKGVYAIPFPSRFTVVKKKCFAWTDFFLMFFF